MFKFPTLLHIPQNYYKCQTAVKPTKYIFIDLKRYETFTHTLCFMGTFHRRDAIQTVFTIALLHQPYPSQETFCIFRFSKNFILYDLYPCGDIWSP